MPLDPRIQAALDAPLTAGPSLEGRGLLVRRRKGGYASAPGTGPTGETCRSCKHCYFVTPNIRRFYKCRLTPFTNGPASDVKVRSPACRQWEPRGE